MTARLTVIGIGADGYAGLGKQARDAIAAAPLVVGSTRQLSLLPDTATNRGARRLAWPSPLEPMLDELAAGSHGDAAILASGDPMLHGIGSSLARRLEASPPREGASGAPTTAVSSDEAASGSPATAVPADEAASAAPATAVPADEAASAAPAVAFSVIPHPSAFALACARLRWPAADTELLSAVAREPELVARALQPGRRLVVYVTGRDGAARLAEIVTARGFGPSRFVVLEQLGGAAEQVHEATAASWGSRAADPLHAVAIEPRPARGTRPRATTPGLPDDAFDHDGQLTKRHVRAVTLAALAPLPGELLWDVGAGSGSIAIEWLRAVPGTRAVAFEADPARAARIVKNARELGVPELEVVAGRAPAALAARLAGAADARPPRGAAQTAAARPAATPPAPDPTPNAIFIGGGLTAPELLATAWSALAPGGRIVANAVTLESQALLVEARAAYGGTLTQIAISHADALGGFTGWRAQMPVVQWEARKPAANALPAASAPQAASAPPAANAPQAASAPVALGRAAAPPASTEEPPPS
jgi:precorrin-6Y C5,15-methyltransferase (decarboxylating)